MTSSIRSSLAVSPSSRRPVGMPVQAETTSAISSGPTFSAIIGGRRAHGGRHPSRLASAASAAAISRSTAGTSPYSTRDAAARSPSRW